jgi:hypothetical protein
MLVEVAFVFGWVKFVAHFYLLYKHKIAVSRKKEQKERGPNAVRLSAFTRNLSKQELRHIQEMRYPNSIGSGRISTQACQTVT